MITLYHIEDIILQESLFVNNDINGYVLHCHAGEEVFNITLINICVNKYVLYNYTEKNCVNKYVTYFYGDKQLCKQINMRYTTMRVNNDVNNYIVIQERNCVNDYVQYFKR